MKVDYDAKEIFKKKDFYLLIVWIIVFILAKICPDKDLGFSLLAALLIFIRVIYGLLRAQPTTVLFSKEDWIDSDWTKGCYKVNVSANEHRKGKRAHISLDEVTDKGFEEIGLNAAVLSPNGDLTLESSGKIDLRVILK